MLPLVLFNTSFGKPGVALKDNGIGFGDLTLGPILQFKPIMAGRRPVFSHRIEILVVAPVGKYNPAKDINQGSNYLSFYPNWALTVMPLPAWEVTARLQYLFNARNDSPTGFPRDPKTGAPLDVKSAQAGQVFLMNFATSYEIFRSFRVGANGYFYTQLNPDTFKLADGTEKDGVALGEGKAQVLGIGPGMVWEAAMADQLFANVYFQPIAKAKAQSSVFQIRWLHGF
jgi:hypothetical protein